MIDVEILLNQIQRDKNSDKIKDTPFEVIHRCKFPWTKIPINDDNVRELINAIVETIYPQVLPKIFREKNIEKFIPAQRPSLEFTDKSISLALYHDTDVHFKIYKSAIDQGYIMQPSGDLLAKLGQLYLNHGLDSTSDAWYREGFLGEDDS